MRRPAAAAAPARPSSPTRLCPAAVAFPEEIPLSRSRIPVLFACALTVVSGVVPSGADEVAQAPPFTQDWSNTALITADDQWSGVPGVMGYRGDDLTTTTGANPQAVLTDGSATPVDVSANQTNPSTFSTGGVAEFHLADPTVALNGSGTADAPHLVLSLATTGRSAIAVAYNLRDLDASADNAVQPVALHYRVGSSGPFTNVPAGHVADATSGPSTATLVTPVTAVLPAAADDHPLVQVRIITANAVGNDEWVGIDDLSITGQPVAGDSAPSVTATTPTTGSVGAAPSSNITVTFDEPVTLSAGSVSVEGSTSGVHAFDLSGGPTTYALDPQVDFATNETVTVRIAASGVSDHDGIDPPDAMTSDFTFTFVTEVRIHDIQGAAHRSPIEGRTVANVPGVVTAVRSNGFWFQDPSPDGSTATSEGLFVFTSSSPTVSMGHAVLVGGRVTEFRPGGSSSTNLAITEITSPTVTATGVGMVTPTLVGPGGRVPPGEVITDDATGNVETSGLFDPENDGIDFHESLEGMLVELRHAEVVGPTSRFGEIPVVAGGTGSVRSPRGGIVIRPGDFNPERFFLDDALVAGPPAVDVGAVFPGSVVGVVDYSFGNFKVLNTGPLPTPVGGVTPETAGPIAGTNLSIATYNVENLDPLDGPARFTAIADQVVDRLRSPDIVALVEIQDNNGPTNDGVVDGSLTGQMLVDAIQSAGGPEYTYVEIDPVDDQDGGEPGGNIRVAYLYVEGHGLRFVSRPGGDATTPVEVLAERNGKPRLSVSPGRTAPTDPAFTNSRKPLAAEFRFHGQPLFIVNNHFNSKGGDQPLFGRFQPPSRSSEAQRHAQAEIVNDFVEEILAIDSEALVAVVGDLNDFQFSETLRIVKGDDLVDLVDRLPVEEQYSYVFDGNSQVLDHILVSDALSRATKAFDIVHINSEFADQVSDHDPSVAQFRIRRSAAGKGRAPGTTA